jgi:hypothetical protein
VERPGVLVTKDEMHRAVWGDAIVSDDTLTHTLAELRRVLRDDSRTPRIIETVHRRGVRFIAPLHTSTAEVRAGAEPSVAREPAADGEAALIVGREAEVGRLHALFRRASTGQREAVFVQGEAGIGKSAIVEVFLRTIRVASEPVLIGYGKSVEQHGEREPYMPVLAAFERLGQGSSPNRVLPALRAVAPSWLARMPALQRPIDAERLRRWHTDATPHRMLRRLVGLVETISIDQPLVLVLEDLHWSDRATVDLLSMLAQRPERARAMVVATYRPAEAAALDHPLQQVVTLLRARPVRGDRGRVPGTERRGHVPRASSAGGAGCRRGGRGRPCTYRRQSPVHDRAGGRSPRPRVAGPGRGALAIVGAALDDRA